MRAPAEAGRGALVARALEGAWRSSVAPLRLAPQVLTGLAPHLIRLGVGALVSRRLRAGGEPEGPAARELRQAFRLQILEARLHERRIVEAVGLLRAAGVEPLLAKGWAAARLYPEQGLRPYGDIDLWVRPDQRHRAAVALDSPRGQRCRVDLHDEFAGFAYDWQEVYRRSRLAPLGAIEVRLLGPEDHLRLLCLHLLGHGAWRPVWLCDVAAAIESAPGELDWDRCLHGRSRQADWIAGTVGLAREVLGARAARGLPDRPVPRWLSAALLRQWGRREHYMSTPSMAFMLRHPHGLLRALRLRWPNPIQATVGVGGPFNRLPRLPFQLAECLARTASFLRAPMPSPAASGALTRDGYRAAGTAAEPARSAR